MTRLFFRRSWLRISVAAVVATGLPVLASQPAHAAPCDVPVVSPVACENTKAGNPASEWDVSGAGDASIQGFPTDISVNVGGTIGFKVDTTASAFRLDVYRMGYYQGNGARKITTITPTSVRKQPACLSDPTTGLVDCGNWTQSASWTVPAGSVSGIYFARLVRTDGVAGASHIVFVVRDDSSHSAMLMQTSDTTWQAYNTYGGNSLYVGSPAGRAYKVSYNRPITTRDTSSDDYVFSNEYPMVRFLEANGYDVSYTTGVDTDRSGALLLNHKIFTSVGHDEYWSGTQRANVEAARAAGVNLSFFSGNEMFWKTRWENAISADGTAYRTLVSYKETHANAVIDPASPVWTGTWRDPRFSPPEDGGRPENGVTGTIFTVNGAATNPNLVVAAADGKSRFWRNTRVAALTGTQTTTVGSNVLGYEWDSDLDNGARPAGTFRLSQTTTTAQILLDYGSTYGTGSATHSMTMYRASSGALVFSSGTVQWVWALDSNHDGGSAAADSAAQQATVNLFADMGVQPTTLIAGLVAATQSVDTTPPTSTITSPANNSTVALGATVTVTGTATDAGGGVVGGVEVSTDNGATWHPATGRASWSYSFTANSNGKPTIRSRATDDSGRIETPSAGVTITVGTGVPATCPCSVWPSTATPAGTDPDTSAVEVGVKFRAAQAGTITGIRFYKGATNTGTHVGHLWTSTGTLLGTVTFSGETASGWQQATFATPITVSANATYIASYFAPGGHYSTSSAFFASAGVTNGPLTALQDGVDGGNGVYAYTATAGAFPNSTFNSENYWVDLVFNPASTGPDTTPPTVTAQAPGSGATGVAVGSTVSATFSEPVQAATVSMTVTPAGGAALAGTTAYSSATNTATFTPSVALAASTTYTVNVSGTADTAGNVMTPVSWTFTTAASVTCPCSIWPSTATPAGTDPDTGSIEVGVKFRAAQAGTITGIRFYKGATNTGTHVGHLWTSTGTLLGTVTFSGETASGWQQATFATPVTVAANTTYVASYYMPSGHYSTTSGFFASAGVTNGPLTALQDGVDGGNAVYVYTPTAGVFPSNTYQSENYWVDVVYMTAAPDTTPPTVTAKVPAAGATAVAVGTTVAATFSEAVTASTVKITVTPAGGAAVAGTTAYNAATQTATFTPSAALAASTTYTVNVSGAADLAGNVMTAVSWTFTTGLVDTTPPTVTAQSPIAGATSVALASTVSATFSEAVQSSTVKITVTPAGGAAVAGAIAYNSATNTATFAPSAALAASTTYTVNVSGAADLAGNVMTPVSSTFTTIAAGACPCSIWSASATPTVAADSDTGAVELGVKFRATQAGTVTGIRFYKGATNTGTHVGSLWTSTGTKLGSVTFAGESASGWQQATFATPIAVTANTTYVASYYAPGGHYSTSSNYFSTSVTSGPLTALANGTDGPNGVYRYSATASAFPSSTFNSTNYWVDVVYAPTPTGPDTTPPTVTTQSPAGGATAVAVSTTVAATFSEAVQAATVKITVTPAGGAAVAGTTAYNTTTNTATFTPTASLVAATTYTVNVSGAADTAGNVMTPVSWSFTTAAPGACPCATIWPASTVPAQPASTDASSVEVGVKFRTTQAGFINAIRFYKGSSNTGTHVGHLWTSTGTLLSTATFTSESATGWQEATLPSPVAVAANTTYVASYLAPVGHYALLTNGLATAVTSGPLTALANGTDGGNGVYLYGGGGFPINSFSSSNYYVDVLFATTSVDTVAPTVTTQVPAAGSTGVSVVAPVQAGFSEPVNPATVSITLTGPGAANVTGTLAYNAGTYTATFAPAQSLAYSTTYQVTVSGARDPSGNLMAPTSWSFTSAPPPPPLPTEGPGGPIGVVTASTDAFSGYFAEILRSEGLNSFATFDIGNLNSTTLASYNTIVLGHVPLTAAQVSTLTTWVQGGGKLIASRPDSQLASLLGLTPSGTTLSDAYLLVDNATSAGAGIVNQSMQFHGTADGYSLSGASAVATLYSNATTATTNPAVTVRSVGTSGGQVAAFTYDLARSIVYTRQGNPAWAGQERDHDADNVIRSDDLYFGGTATDYVDLNKVAIPQADEQQRLLANLIETMNRDTMPFPRFWYFPGTNKAVVVATGDDHANGGTTGRFNTFLAADAPGCSTTNWTCHRFTSFVYPNEPMTNAAAAAFNAQGFEIGLHPQNGCTNFTSTTDLRSTYSTQLAQWKAAFPSLPSPVSNRFHCLVWSDWSSQYQVESENGMRFDTNYYYWPGSWLLDRPGFMTGSGMPQRFANLDGTMVDVLQATTQMTDESGQTYPFTPDTLLNNALGTTGYYGYFTANMHTDLASTQPDDALLSSANSHGVPIVSARSALAFIDGKNQSSFKSLGWNAATGTLTFAITVGSGANNLTAMLPTAGPGAKLLKSITVGATTVPFTKSTIKGIEYAQFPATAATYTATYTIGGLSAVAGGTVTTATDGTANVNWITDVPATGEVHYGPTTDLGTTVAVGGTAGTHDVGLKGLQPDTVYHYRITSTAPDGSRSTWPSLSDPPATFRTPAADKTAPTLGNLAVAARADGTALVNWNTDEPSDGVVRFGTAADQLSGSAYGARNVTAHVVVLTGLDPRTTYHLQVESTDQAGNRSGTTGSTLAFTMPKAGVAEYMAASQRVGQLSGGAKVQEDMATGLGRITLAPGATNGTFVSRPLDARIMATWDALSWEATVPAGTTIRLSVRGGNSETVGDGWSEWAPVAASGDHIALTSRFVEYRVELTGTAAARPELSGVSITYQNERPAHIDEQGGATARPAAVTAHQGSSTGTLVVLLVVLLAGLSGLVITKRRRRRHSVAPVEDDELVGAGTP